MSYDYMLIKGTPDAGLEMLMETAMSEPIGSVTEVKAQISRTFPSVSWEAPATSVLGLENEGVFGHSGPPEFQLTTEPDGLVHLITMSRAEREEVELLANTLGLVVIDEQSMDMFGG